MALHGSEQPFNSTPVEKQPVPPLQQTIQLFLKSVRPFVNDEEFNVTTSLAHEFAASGGPGERLQAILEERYKTLDNWMEDWWLNYAYLEYRAPLLINSNTAMTFSTKEISSVDDQLQISASFIATCLDFKRILDEGKLPQDKLGPFALDMTQNYLAFGSCRIPGEKKDSLRYGSSEHGKHVMVLHNYHFFMVPAYSDNGERLSHAQLVQQLRTVMEQSPEPSPNPVGILTSEKRETWYRMRQELLKEPQNRETLDLIETSLMVVSLDAKPDKEEQAEDKRDEAAALKMMHGGGTNTPNRWLDKILNGVLGWYGCVGMTGEHSAIDGHATSHLFNYVGANLLRVDTQPSVQKFSPPKKLQWVVNDDIKKSIEEAKLNAQKLIDDFELKCYKFKHYGSDAIKSMRLSPDSFIQMAMQLAFYRMHGVPTAQYEAAVLRRFLHGRTEAIRSCSEQTVQFCRIMMDATANCDDKAKALRTAVNTHKEIALLAVSGEGIDRHLLGLRLAAKQIDMEEPKLFQDPGFTRSGYYRLSTSQMPLLHSNFVAFGPPVPDGYGICYSPLKDKIMFGISAYNSCADTNASKFVEALEKSCLDMRDVLTQAS